MAALAGVMIWITLAVLATAPAELEELDLTPRLRAGLGVQTKGTVIFHKGVLGAPVLEASALVGSQLTESFAVYVRLRLASWMIFVARGGGELMVEYSPVDRVSLAVGLGAGVLTNPIPIGLGVGGGLGAFSIGLPTAEVPWRVAFALGRDRQAPTDPRDTFFLALDGGFGMALGDSLLPYIQFGISFGFDWR